VPQKLPAQLTQVILPPSGITAAPAATVHQSVKW
jgi:hypothetical protein